MVKAPLSGTPSRVELGLRGRRRCPVAIASAGANGALKITNSRCSTKHNHPSAESLSGESKRTDPRRQPARDLLVIGGLVLLTVVVAARLYDRYLPTAQGQWAFLGHDRNAHLLKSMLFALDLRHVDLVNFVRDLHGSQVHPPLFAMVAAPILVIGGLAYQAAALVSLGGWIGTIILVFWLAGRLAASHRNAVGLVAALFALGSPAYQTYATDIMLESLGSCLTLLALHLYLSKRGEAGAARDFAWLGGALTALFFVKYNYWFLTIFVFLLWEWISGYREITAGLRRRWAQGDIRALLLGEICHPLTWAVAALAGVTALLLLTGGWEFWWAGQRVRVKASLNLGYGFFLLLGVRTALLWWRNEHNIRSLVDDRAKQLARWHLLPVTAWLLWPHKLGSVLRTLGPTNSEPWQRAVYWRWDTVLFYPRAIAREYHANSWTALAAIALALVAFCRVARLTAQGRLVLLFLTTSAILTTLHPNHQSRYVHTWISLLWIAGAIGLASTLDQAARARCFRVTRGTVSAGVLAMFIAAMAIEPLALVFAGRRVTDARPQVATALDLSDYYLPRVACYEHVAIFATVPIYHFAWWSYLQRYPARRGTLAVSLEKFGDSAALNQRWFMEWLDRTPTEAMVFIDIPPGSVFYSVWPGEERFQQYRELVEGQTVFREAARQVFPQYGSTVRILVRTQEGTSRVRCNDTRASAISSPHDLDDRPAHLPSRPIKS